MPHGTQTAYFNVVPLTPHCTTRDKFHHCPKWDALPTLLRWTIVDAEVTFQVIDINGYVCCLCHICVDYNHFKFSVKNSSDFFGLFCNLISFNKCHLSTKFPTITWGIKLDVNLAVQLQVICVVSVFHRKVLVILPPRLCVTSKTLRIGKYGPLSSSEIQWIGKESK